MDYVVSKKFKAFVLFLENKISSLLWMGETRMV
jgi:hypothetical protein